MISAETIKIIIIFYLTKGVINADLYTCGTPLKEFVIPSLIIEHAKSIKLSTKKRVHISFSLTNTNGFARSNNLLVKRGVIIPDNILDKSFFKENNEFYPNNTIKRFIKHLSEKFMLTDQTDVIYFNETTVDSYTRNNNLKSEDVTSERKPTHKIIDIKQSKKLEEPVITTTNTNSKNPNILANIQIDTKPDISDLLLFSSRIRKTKETTLNDKIIRVIKMLKEITFLGDNDFYVHKDIAIKDNVCGFAKGDWLTNRHLVFDHKQGLEFCISRLNSEMVDDYLSNKINRFDYQVK